MPEFSITLKRNDNYWNKNNIPNYPDKLVFKTIQDQSAAISSIKNKDLDIMFVIQPKNFIEDLSNPEQYGLKKTIVAEPTYTFIAWNNKHPLFSDKKVRWALSYAIDRHSIIDNVIYGLGDIVQSPVFIKSKYYNTELPEIQYNLEEARKILNEQGWKDSDGDGIIDKYIEGKKTDFKFTFMNNGNPKRKKCMLLIIEQLKRIGIEAYIQDYEWSVFLDKTKKHQFDACYSAWQIGVTADDPYQIWHSSQNEEEGSNFINYNNPESDKILEENRTLFDETHRVELLKQWQQIIYDDQPVTFLWTELSRYVYSDRFKNTNFYKYPNSPLFNEWWVPKSMQNYK